MTTYVGGRGRVSGPAQASLPLYGQEDIWFANEIGLIDTWTHPVNQILQRLGQVRAGTVPVHWFDDVHRGVYDTVSYSTGYSNSATGLVMSNPGMWVVGDFARDDATGEVMLVTSVGSTYIGVVRDYYQSTESYTARKSTIADAAVLKRLPASYEQAHPTPEPSTTTPVEYVNYHHDYRTSVKMSEILAATNLRGGDDWAFQMRKKGAEHLQGIDAQFFDGILARGDGGRYDSTTGNTAPTSAAGLDYYLTLYGDSSKKKDETELTEYEFIDWLEAMAYGGSERKFVFCPASLFTAFGKWDSPKQFKSVTDKAMGFNITRWERPGKVFDFIQHDHLRDYYATAGTYYQRAFCVDFEDVMYTGLNELGPTRMVPVEVRRAGSGYTDKVAEYQTVFSFVFRNFTGSNGHHGRLRWKTIATA